MTEAAFRLWALKFGEFTLDDSRAALFRDGAEVHLRRQSFEVLRHLATHAGRLVTKDELFATVWPGTVVTDDSLTQCLVEIRRAIGDGGREIIRTVPRRGFVFEMPVEVVGGETPGQASAVATTGDSRSLRRPGLVALALAATAAGALWWAAGRFVDRAPVSDAMPGHAAADVSIAVLPFVDLSDAQDQQYFAEGLSEEVLNLLAQIPELRVIARTSSFSFRDRPELDVREIGRRLGVTHLLEGSVRRSGERVRITAQLVEAGDGSHLWSHSFDREAGDDLDAHTAIAGAIARTLQVRLADDVLRTAARPVDPAAQDHYLHGRFLWSRRSAGDLRGAQEHLERAVAIDPRYGPAWGLLSGVAVIRIHEDGLDPGEGLALAGRAIGQALALDPASGEIHARATQYYLESGDLAQARTHWRQALALDPDNPLVIGYRAGAAAWRGDTRKAVDIQRQLVALDPVGFLNRSNLSGFLEIDGQFEEAWTEFLRARELNPAYPGSTQRAARLLIMRGRLEEGLSTALELEDGADRDQVLTLAYRGLGRSSEADASYSRLLARPDGERALRLAQLHAWTGDDDEAFAWLARARDVAVDAAHTPGRQLRPLEYPQSGFTYPLRDDPRSVQFRWDLERAAAAVAQNP